MPDFLTLIRSAMIDMAEMSMMGLARRQQDGGPPMIQQRTSLKRTLSRGSGTFKREQSLRGLTDAPLLTPCIILSPNAEEFLSCVVECVKDVLTVTAWGARPLTTYPDVKSMLKDMFGSSLGLSPTKAPASQLTQDRLLTLPGPERPLSKGKEALHTAEGPTRLRTLSFGIMQNFSSAAVNESNASAPASHADVDDDFNADDPLGVLKGNFGGGLSQSLPRVSSMKGGSSCRHSSGTIAPLPAYSPYEVIKRVLGERLLMNASSTADYIASTFFPQESFLFKRSSRQDASSSMAMR